MSDVSVVCVKLCNTNFSKEGWQAFCDGWTLILHYCLCDNFGKQKLIWAFDFPALAKNMIAKWQQRNPGHFPCRPRPNLSLRNLTWEILGSLGQALYFRNSGLFGACVPSKQYLFVQAHSLLQKMCLSIAVDCCWLLCKWFVFTYWYAAEDESASTWASKPHRHNFSK